MKNLEFLAMCFILLLVTGCGRTWTVTQLSLWEPAQLVKKEKSVYGLRANLGYSNNKYLVGADMGLGVNYIDETATGIQVAGIANASTCTLGLQTAGLVNVAGGVYGIQLSSLMNLAVTVNGIQINGGLNWAAVVNGIQISIIGGNLAQEIVNGLQVTGVVNGSIEGLRGIQISGISNLVGYDDEGDDMGLANVDGIQLTGFQNRVSGNVDGMQLSLVNNYSGDMFAGHR